MAIDITVPTTFFTDGLTTITTLDPNGQYTAMSLAVYCQDGQTVPCAGQYTAPTGEFITPQNVNDICKAVYNNLTTANDFFIRRYQDGLNLPSGDQVRMMFYNTKLSMYGIIATLK